MGNYSAGLPQDEKVKEGVPFWDLAREIAAETAKSLEKSHQFSELSVLNMLLSQLGVAVAVGWLLVLLMLALLFAKLHEEILQTSHLRSSLCLHNLLVKAYGQCGCLSSARGVFDAISDPNVFSWNILMTAHAQNGHITHAKEVFDRHPRKNVVSWNSMITAFSASGEVVQAREVFDSRPRKNVVSWNAMLTAYA